MGDESRPKFHHGRCLATPAALAAIEAAAQTPNVFLDRHVRGDWGDVPAEDRRLNDEAILDGTRLLSAYATALGLRIWVITEAADDEGRRESTTILLPDEY